MKLCHFELSEKYCIGYCTNIIKIYSYDRNEKVVDYRLFGKQSCIK